MIQIKGKISDIPDEEDLTRFLENAAEYMYESVTRNFFSGGRPSPWPPIKKTGAPSHLVETGRLLSSIRKEVNPKAGFARVYIPSGAVPYAFAHNFGYPPQNMPQREFMLWQAEDVGVVMEMYKDHLLAFIQTSKREI